MGKAKTSRTQTSSNRIGVSKGALRGLRALGMANDPYMYAQTFAHAKDKTYAEDLEKAVELLSEVFEVPVATRYSGAPALLESSDPFVSAFPNMSRLGINMGNRPFMLGNPASYDIKEDRYLGPGSQNDLARILLAELALRKQNNTKATPQATALNQIFGEDVGF